MKYMKNQSGKNARLAEGKKSAWRRFVEGMASLWPHEPPDYLPPNGGGFAADRKSATGDWRNLGDDLRKAVRKHGQTAASSR